jgi:uncharacterized iron-regulated membrane protein
MGEARHPSTHTRHAQRRAVLLKMHLALSLVGGALVVLLCATGSVLVFHGEIDRALNPALFRATAGDVGFDEAERRAVATFPGRAVRSIAAPGAGEGVYQVALASDPPLTVYIDPGSGEVLGSRDPARTCIGVIRGLHRNLLAGSVGRSLVGVAGLMLLALVASGCYLWWPRRDRVVHLGFVIRRGRGDFVLHFDLHKVCGILSALPLTAIAYTGVLLVWGDLPHTALAKLAGADPYREPERDYVKSQPSDRSAVATSELAVLAARAVPGAAVTSVDLPLTATEPAVVSLRLPDDPRTEGSSKVWLDAYSGLVRARVNTDKLATPDWLFRMWRVGIHAGAYGGILTRVVHGAVGVMPLALMATGLVLWRRRRQFARGATRRGRRRRARLGGRKASRSRATEGSGPEREISVWE